jgi:hypothetical protein
MDKTKKTSYAEVSAVTLAAHRATLTRFTEKYPYMARIIEENDAILFPGQDVFDGLDNNSERKHPVCPPAPARSR